MAGPVPIWPSELDPQHQSWRDRVSAQECSRPACTTRLARSNPGAKVAPPGFPVLPSSGLPPHQTSPASVTSQLWYRPALDIRTVRSVEIRVIGAVVAMEPVPACPSSLNPQQTDSSVVVIPQAW